MEDAFFYRINPAMVVAQKYRKSYIPGILLYFFFLKLIVFFIVDFFGLLMNFLFIF